MEAVPTQLPESRERAKVPVSWPVTHVKSRVHRDGCECDFIRRKLLHALNFNIRHVLVALRYEKNYVGTET